MHPSLQLNNISNLPTASLRRSATLAANGSLEHLRKLHSLTTKSPTPYIHLLPVFYRNIDPTNIPSLSNLEQQILLPDVRDAISRAELSLACLYLLDERGGTPPGANTALWPRVWQWSSLLAAYPHCSSRPRGNEEQRFLHLFYYIGRLYHHAATARLMHTTPGLRVVIAKSWGLMLNRPPIGPAIHDLCSFIENRDGTADPEHFDEFAEGAGGAAVDLALLVIKHVDSTLENLKPDARVGDMSIWTRFFLIRAGLRFAMTWAFDGRFADFCRALLAHGIIATTIHVIDVLAGNLDLDGAVDLLETSFILLDWTSHAMHRRRWVIEALGSGSLRVMIDSEWHGPKDTGRFAPVIDCYYPAESHLPFGPIQNHGFSCSLGRFGPEQLLCAVGIRGRMDHTQKFARETPQDLGPVQL
ncbi:hypothetical protein B0H15DRAFT_244777 [Mycena belliarum]|uniref:Uncharacterized protein n=1 Tax=Mycena belliarum TaxID=1033014 RepID=A0AAD6U5G1_9AGAR|nr:hypothetical protein B0H15DRAFT_244777 [Mycena belliae]